MKNISKKTFIPILIILAIILVLFIILSLSNQNIKTKDISLGLYNGIGGNKCRVLVNGKTYEIPEGTKSWKNGMHTESRGLAKCGEDLTNVLQQSPHKDSVLKDLIEIKP